MANGRLHAWWPMDYSKLGGQWKVKEKHLSWHTPKSLVELTWRSNYVELWKVGTWGPFSTSSTKRG
jgi:hypothetical protein